MRSVFAFVAAAWLAVVGFSVARVAVGAADSAIRSDPGAPYVQTPLDRYLGGLRTLRVTFAQALTDGRGKEVQRGEGTLVVSRPGRFRWEIKPEGTDAGQLLIADGRNLWFFDRDLEQVTVKPVGTTLSATPALLLSGSGNVRDSFVVSNLPKRGGLDWVLVKPKRAQEADFREARLGFVRDELTRMELADRLGQVATLVFLKAARNGPVDDAELAFAPPAGVDVIGKPQN